MLRQSMIDKLERATRARAEQLGPMAAQLARDPKEDLLFLIGFGTKRDLERQLTEQSSVSREELRQLARDETFWGVPVRILRDVESTLLLVRVLSQ